MKNIIIERSELERKLQKKGSFYQAIKDLMKKAKERNRFNKNQIVVKEDDEKLLFFNTYNKVGISVRLEEDKILTVATYGNEGNDIKSFSKNADDFAALLNYIIKVLNYHKVCKL